MSSSQDEAVEVSSSDSSDEPVRPAKKAVKRKLFEGASTSAAKKSRSTPVAAKRSRATPVASTKKSLLWK
jgi:hypothetical protein